MDKEIKDLGVVLGIANEINKDMLSMLAEQQKRQVRMIWASLAIILVAFVVVALSMFCAFQSFDKLHQQIDKYHGGICYEETQSDSKENPQ